MLVDWLDSPDSIRGIRFAAEDGTWSAKTTYAELAADVHTAAARIADAAPAPGQRLLVCCGDPRHFVAAFWGTLVAGHTPTPLMPPTVIADPAAYVRRFAGIADVADPALVLSDATTTEALGPALEATGLAGRTLELDIDSEVAAAPARPPAELSLLQFTSGSTAAPRGTKVTHDNLERNVEMITRWLRWTAESPGISWLPLFHDMGLIGCMITPVIRQSDLWLMTPTTFVRSPETWLDPLGREGVTMTAAPNFGYAYARARLERRDLGGYDFSSWRIAMSGAERIDPRQVSRFIRWLAPHGFRPDAFVPAYGLAEATLAVSGKHAGAPARFLQLEAPTLRLGDRVATGAEAGIDDAERIGRGEGWIASCGAPVAGVEVAILDAEARPLPEGHLGEIVVRSPSVASGYLNDEAATAERFRDGGVHTRDAGFLAGGELFVVGRMADSVKVRGETVYMDDLEARLTARFAIKPGSYVVVGGPRQGDREPVVAMVAELEPGEWSEQCAELLSEAVGGSLTVEVYAGPRGSLMRTSSGKPRRQPMWSALVGGDLPVERIVALPSARERELAGERT